MGLRLSEGAELEAVGPALDPAAVDGSNGRGC